MIHVAQKVQPHHSRLSQVPSDVLEDYVQRRITSRKFAELTGMNASYIRRTVRRVEKSPTSGRPDKSALVAARRAYRMTLSDKKATEIADLAHVSLRTAQRIKAKAAKLAPKAQT